MIYFQFQKTIIKKTVLYKLHRLYGFKYPLYK